MGWFLDGGLVGMSGFRKHCEHCVGDFANTAPGGAVAGRTHSGHLLASRSTSSLAAGAGGADVWSTGADLRVSGEVPMSAYAYYGALKCSSIYIIMIRMLFGSTKNFVKETNHCEKSTSMRS